MPDEQDSAELKTPIGNLSLRTKKMVDLITIISFVTLTLVALMVWEHKNDSKVYQLALLEAITSLTHAQRMNTCIISIPQERRESEMITQSSFCNRMSTQR